MHNSASSLSHHADRGDIHPRLRSLALAQVWVIWPNPPRIVKLGCAAALGASKARVLMEILMRAMRQIGIGIAIGVLGAGALARLVGDSAKMMGLLVLLAQVAGMMVLVGVIASIGPVRRALRVEPTEALQAE